jgi:hypothetical protein
MNSARSWALLTLSSPVTDAHTSNPTLWPSGWIVLSQREWKRRDALYQKRRKEALVSRQNFNMLPEQEQEVAAAAATAAPPKHMFEPGLIVHIAHLHTGVNKPVISSFIMRSVDRYLRKREKKRAATSGDEEELQQQLHKVQINYIDYKKDGDSCYLRQSTRTDSELIVAALKKRKRTMLDGNDRKGRKAKEGFVVGRLLEGEEEMLYWRTVQASDAAKKGRKGKSGGGGGGGGGASNKMDPPITPARTTVDVRHGGKRPRLSSGASSSSPAEIKRKRPSH